MIEVTVRLTNAEAEAVLRSEGLHNGHGVAVSKTLAKAETKLLDAIQNAWNERITQTQA